MVHGGAERAGLSRATGRDKSTIAVNGAEFTSTFQPDDARGTTYRSACGGRTYRCALTLTPRCCAAGRTRSPCSNKGAARLVHEAAYDAIRLEIAG